MKRPTPSETAVLNEELELLMSELKSRIREKIDEFRRDGSTRELRSNIREFKRKIFEDLESYQPADKVKVGRIGIAATLVERFNTPAGQECLQTLANSPRLLLLLNLLHQAPELRTRELLRTYNANKKAYDGSPAITQVGIGVLLFRLRQVLAPAGICIERIGPYREGSYRLRFSAEESST